MICFFIGCHNAENKETISVPAAKTETREDSLYRQIMDMHNEVMNKMGKLNGYKKKVQQQRDSIKTMLASTDFPKQVSQRITHDLNSLDTLSKKLQDADNAMNAWMEQFNPDPKLATSNANADYFADQKKKAEIMKRMFFEALEEAEKFLK